MQFQPFEIGKKNSLVSSFPTRRLKNSFRYIVVRGLEAVLMANGDPTH